MRPTHSRSGGRSAFTLVEILVVISIITILVALAAVGVIGALSTATLTTTKVEIDQMAAGIVAAKNTYQVKYLPSRIVLREDNNYDPNNAEHARTVKFLQQMFPKISLLPSTPIDWNGDGAIESAKGGDDGKGNWILLADQTLVFFLGGIPAPVGGPNGCLGFATDPKNPASIADLAAGRTTSPSFDFVPARLQRGNNKFFRYVDPWKTNSPYLYFSTYGGSDNNYHIASAIDKTADCPLGLKDAAGNPVIVSPYIEAMSPVRFTNASSFQILSAGKDGVFGPGGLWDPAKGVVLNSPGADDQANFSGNILGKAR
jgi:prepilin-type N-terminal cleavage/methylation domain-containing protein